jgi:hypothetical protein
MFDLRMDEYLRNYLYIFEDIHLGSLNPVMNTFLLSQSWCF